MVLTISFARNNNECSDGMLKWNGGWKKADERASGQEGDFKGAGIRMMRGVVHAGTLQSHSGVSGPSFFATRVGRSMKLEIGRTTEASLAEGLRGRLALEVRCMLVSLLACLPATVTPALGALWAA